MRSTPPTGGRYRWYVLFVLTLALALSLLDRQVLTILAGPIKADLGLSDAEIGLLYGTTFAVFYSLFGIPLGRVADVWLRGRLMALGLLGWSAMTIFSGFAANLTQLVIARMGVGVGEATANSATYSLLSDYFPKERRATAIAIYSCGVSFGLGASLWLGGRHRRLVACLVRRRAHAAGPESLAGGVRPRRPAGRLRRSPGLAPARAAARLRRRAGADRAEAALSRLLRRASRHPAAADFWRTSPSCARRAAPGSSISSSSLPSRRRLPGLSSSPTASSPPPSGMSCSTSANFAITGHTVQWTRARHRDVRRVLLGAVAAPARCAYALIFRSPAMLGLMAAASST